MKLTGTKAIKYAEDHELPVERDDGSGTPTAWSPTAAREVVAQQPDHEDRFSVVLDADQELALADLIAAEHGCVIEPTPAGVPAVCVPRQYQRGDVDDRARATRARDAISDEGINTDGWLLH